MGFVGHLDQAGEFALHGWAHSKSLPDLTVHVDVVINRRHIACVPASCFRHDLRSAGFGDGRKSFWFNPFEHLDQRENVVEVFVAGTDHLLTGGRRVISSRTVAEHTSQLEAKSRAEARWSGDEDDASLTWGNIMTGDSFLDEVERSFRFTSESRILEIGPGYGRLLTTILGREHPFSEFIGLELSPARTKKLSERFGSSRVSFAVGNCDSQALPKALDMVFSSSTFEHLFPSIRPTLCNIHAGLKPGGMVFIDFISHDDNLAISRAYFEESLGGAYIRIYSRSELEGFFSEAGFKIIRIVNPLVLGEDVGGREIKRALVAAVRQ